MKIRLRLDSFFNDIQIGVRNSVLPTVHSRALILGCQGHFEISCYCHKLNILHT
jgi:hypothetical protein